MSAPRLIAVMGPTASGKTELAEQLAAHLKTSILNADAFQVYRGLDIGTAKPTHREQYSLLDLKDPDEDFGVGEYVLLACAELQRLHNLGQHAIICGGTGFYIRALIEEFQNLSPAPDPALREKLRPISLEDARNQLLELLPSAGDKIDLNNPIRVKRALEKVLVPSEPIRFKIPPFLVTKAAIVPTVENSQQKIEQRTKKMIQNGWVAEVNELINKGYGSDDPGFRAIGYQAIAQYIEEGGSEEDLIQKIELDTVQYAKRQRTWLRSEPNLIVFDNVDNAWNALR